MNAFAIATAIGLGWPLLVLPLAVAAACVAASRVLLGLHYVSDVVVGALLGSAIGAATFLAVAG